MPDFAPNVTPRYKLHYHVAGRDHTTQCRGARGITFAAMEVIGRRVFNNLFGTLAGTMFDDLSFTSAEIALTDSDLFFPALVPLHVVGLQVIATASKQDSITHLTFEGRGAGTGSKVNFKLYGAQTNPDLLPASSMSDFVFNAGESIPVDAAVAILRAEPDLRAIDNSSILWSARVPFKVNDFWLKRVRAGG